MVVDLSRAAEVFLICGKTDLRKGIDGLAQLISLDHQLDPFKDAVFLFCGSKSDRLKALYWDGDGFYLLYKRLENGRFNWPRSSSDALKLTPIQLHNLLTGYAISPSIYPAKKAPII